MTSVGSPQELTGALPDLDITQFNHWEDYLYNLQVGHTKLPNIDSERVSNIGHYGFCISQHLIQGLREDQLDENGQPFVICVDEVKDEQVITEASAENRQQSFIQAFLSEATERGFHHLHERAESYATAAVTLGSAITGMEQAKVVELLQKTLDQDTQLLDLDKDVLKQALISAKDEEIKTLTQYLQFSQTQMTNEEQRVMVTAQKEAPRLGDEPITISGEELHFVGSGDPPVEMTPDDIALLVPLQKAIKRSRQDMIEQAREFSFQYLGLDREKFSNRTPPEWWVKGEDGEGLRSNEVLVYIPFDAKELENTGTPQFVKKLMSEEEFRFGWNKLVVSKEQPNFIIGIHKLNN